MKKHNFPSFFHSVLVSFVVLILYFLWFIFLDRRFVFLYGHLHSTPFDFRTVSRYFMTGLVASGTILIAYTIFNLVIKKVRHSYQLPDWKIVWKYTCLILALPIFTILAFLGKPPLPLLLSFWILVVLFAGLRLALYASNFIVNNFYQSVFAFFDGLALIPTLLLIPLGIEFGLRKFLPVVLFIASVAAIGMSLFGLWIMTLLYKRLKQSYPSSLNLFLSGLTTAYLLLPLYHYLTSRPKYIYISDSANFFASSIWLQAITFLVTFGVIWLVNRWRGKKVNNLDPVKRLLFLLVMVTVFGFLVIWMTTGKETDVWLCKDDKWVKQGNPPYEKPFDEECGIIDKAMGL